MPGLLVKILPPPEKFRVGSFADSIDYARGADHDDERDRVPERDISGNMPARADGHRGQLIAMQGVTDLDRAALEMDAVADKSRAKDSVLHMVLSYGERVPAELVAEDARRLLAVLGASEHQYVCLGHDDVTGNYHAHLIVNRTHPVTHKAIHMSHSFARLECEATRINHARAWRIIPGQWNGHLIDQYAQEEREQIAREAQSPKEKADELDRIKRQNRRAVSARKSVPERAPRRAQSLGQKRLRVLSGRGVAYPGGQAPAVLSRDVSAPGQRSRRLRVLEAADQRNERAAGGLIPDYERRAAAENGRLPAAQVLGPEILATYRTILAGPTQDRTIRNFVSALEQLGIETIMTVDPGDPEKKKPRVPKISFSRKGDHVTGSQIELHAYNPATGQKTVTLRGGTIEAAFGPLDPALSTGSRIEPGSKPARTQSAPISATAPASVQRNAALKAEFDRYREIAAENRRLERKNLREQAWNNHRADRDREILKLEKSARRKKMFWDAFFDAFGKSKTWRGYKRNRNHPLKHAMRRLIDKGLKRRKDAIYAEYSARWKAGEAERYAHARYPEPMIYLAWLKSRSQTPEVTAELAAITATRYKAQSVSKTPRAPKVDKPAQRPPQARQAAIPPAATMSPPDRPIPTNDERKKGPISTRLFDAWREDRLREAYREIRLEVTTDREIQALDGIKALLDMPLPKRSPDLELDRRRRAAFLIESEELEWKAAIHKIRADDSKAAQARAGKSWGKKGRDDRGGIGD